LVESVGFIMNMTGPAPVISPAISDTSRTASPPPTLSWNNNCHLKFKAWFANDADFTKKGIKKKAFSSKVKNPNDNGGNFEVLLTDSQWQSIRKLVGDEIGATVYWYVESWDGLKNRSETDGMSFILTE